MNSKSLSALLYVGLCLALCLTGVQLAIAASVPDGLDPARRALETSIGTPEAYAEAGVWLVEAFDDRLVLAVSAGEPSITHVQLPDGSVCQEVSLPGYQSIAEPGHPALPSATAALGIPITSSPTVRIVDSESIRLPGVYALCPEPSPVLNSDVTDGMTSPVSSWQRIPHPDAFNKDAPIPANTVEIASTGSIRDQRIAQLVAQPLQYNPVSGEIRIFTQMTVEVRLNVTPSDTEVPLSANPNAAVQPFEGLLRSYLLNYEQATAWRNVPSPAATGEIAANILLKATATGTPVYRIEIREAGLYQLAYTDLQAADPSIDLASVDPRTFHLSTHGQEVAIEVTGQDDSSFDLGDAIYFYAETINTVYANTNVYWLTWNETAGLRMIMLDATPSGTAQVPEHFTTTLHLEEDLAYRRALVTADGDNWFWSDLRDTGTPATASYTFQIPNLAVGALTATLGGDLLGYGTVAYHSVEVHLNNQRVHSATWATQTEHQFEVPFPHSYLVPGTNVLSVTIGVGNLSDYVVVNRFALTHAALYT
ncbi:MAG: hypothetical protein MUF84_16585, partial [Anaerolineae bacterium]|nr:hypothetical protein [Anaerolineae bacterium]